MGSPLGNPVWGYVEGVCWAPIISLQARVAVVARCTFCKVSVWLLGSRGCGKFWSKLIPISKSSTLTIENCCAVVYVKSCMSKPCIFWLLFVDLGSASQGTCNIKNTTKRPDEEMSFKNVPHVHCTVVFFRWTSCMFMMLSRFLYFSVGPFPWCRGHAPNRIQMEPKWVSNGPRCQFLQKTKIR